MHRKLGRTVAAGFIATIAAMAFASPASAGILTTSAKSCDGSTVTQPFSRFGDYAGYKLVSNGSFESGATGWTLKGAKVVTGSETYNVGGAGQRYSLSLPSGSSAVSPFTCV